LGRVSDAGHRAWNSTIRSNLTSSLHVRLNLDTTLDDVDPLGPERFAVRAVNRAVNKVSEKNIDAIERGA
jgi:hypothetical protein